MIEPCRKFRFHSLVTGHLVESSLSAYWEVEVDSISDEFTPAKITATDLLSAWVEEVKSLPDAIVPIRWFVTSDQGLEAMPFQFCDSTSENFLTHHSWPEDAVSGEPLNWLLLPVVDKHWNSTASDKGGFIQEATGWKPSILQPSVYLPSLTKTRKG